MGSAFFRLPVALQMLNADVLTFVVLAVVAVVLPIYFPRTWEFLQRPLIKKRNVDRE